MSSRPLGRGVEDAVAGRGRQRRKAGTGGSGAGEHWLSHTALFALGSLKETGRLWRKTEVRAESGSAGGAKARGIKLKNGRFQKVIVARMLVRITSVLLA